MLLKMLRSMLPRAQATGTEHHTRHSAGESAAGGARLSGAFSAAGRCKICGGAAYLFDVVDFNKHCGADAYQFGLTGVPVYYSRCLDCGFVFTTHFDDWDTARFARLVYNDDYTKVDPEYGTERPRRAADYFAQLCPHASSASILDYGSGSGAFGRELDARGFRKVTNYDPYSSPARPSGTFDIITCIEVMEHAPDPHGTLRDLLTFARPDTTVFFTTLLQPDDIERIRADWWYIGPRNGHISIYSDMALDALAAAHELYFLPGQIFHAFSKRPDAEGLPSHRPRFGVGLYAPNQDEDGWLEIKNHPRGEFRWSAKSRIRWRYTPPVFPCSICVRIPLLMEVAPDFASRCELQYGSDRGPLEVTRLAQWNGLIARMELTAPHGEITLVTPEPLAPEPGASPRGIAVPLRIGGKDHVQLQRAQSIAGTDH